MGHDFASSLHQISLMLFTLPPHPSDILLQPPPTTPACPTSTHFLPHTTHSHPHAIYMLSTCHPHVTHMPPPRRPPACMASPQTAAQSRNRRLSSSSATTSRPFLPACPMDKRPLFQPFFQPVYRPRPSHIPPRMPARMPSPNVRPYMIRPSNFEDPYIRPYKRPYRVPATSKPFPITHAVFFLYPYGGLYNAPYTYIYESLSNSASWHPE